MSAAKADPAKATIAAPSATAVIERFNIFYSDFPVEERWRETCLNSLLPSKGLAFALPSVSPLIVSKFKKIRAISTHCAAIPCAMLNNW
jgi:hypothetical protein